MRRRARRSRPRGRARGARGHGDAPGRLSGRGALSGARASTPRDRGQASVELLGALPVLIVVGLVAMQLLAVGYSAVLAGSAAEAGALALAAGGDAPAGVRQALPGWSRARARVSVDGDTVEVRLRPPSPLAAVARRLEVRADAAVGSP